MLRGRISGLVAGIVAALLLLGAGFMAGRAVQASAAEPGSEADPIVSKSYVDQYVELKIVQLSAGQRLVVDLPGTEIIVRAGQTVAIGSEAGGLADITGGRDAGTGEKIPLNHMLVVPRPDGRGVEAITDAVIMVRGSYVIR